jgi:DNA-binding protein HU-beta
MATIGKTELIARMARRSGKSLKESGEVVNTALEVIRDALKGGEEVRLTGFGSFGVRTAAARMGVNPQTRAKIRIPAKRRVRFSAGKDLSEAVTGSAAGARRSSSKPAGSAASSSSQSKAAPSRRG